MLKFNLCLFKQGDQILLLNREKPSWMGCWNGIGGKLELNECPRASMLREIEEETQIKEFSLHFKGLVTWVVDGVRFGGMYIYLAEIPNDYPYHTPIKTDEGILDWKELSWILHPENQGIAKNIPMFLETILRDTRIYDHHCQYLNEDLISHLSTPIEPMIEENEVLRKDYLGRYNEVGSGVI